MITKQQLTAAIRKLGLSGQNVCIHSSLRSFGDRLEKGPATVAEAFLGEGCTILVPSFSYEYQTAPDPQYMPERNAYPYEGAPELEENGVYQADTAPVSKDMGAFPAYLVTREDSMRGGNPLNSFAAAGKNAAALVGGQSAKDVYAPFRELCRTDGFVLLLGVGLTRCTAIHYAEQQAGRELFVRWAKAPGGKTIPVQTGSCSEGFEAFAPVLAPAVRTVQVGESRWQVIRARELVRLCADAIRKNPGITHCGDPDCGRCNDAVRGGPVINFEW